MVGGFLRRPTSGPGPWWQRGGTAAWACLLSCGGSPGPGEREDVFRASLIMAASEEINRQGPAGMLRAPGAEGGGGGGGVARWKERRGFGGVGGRPGGG